MKIIYTICFSFLGCGVSAQTLPNADTARVAYDSTFMMDELVISANKIPEVRERISQQIFVISDLEIKNLNAQSTADLIANSGTVTIQKSQQGGGSPQLRGFEANRILLVVDGVRMNNLIYRGGHLQNILTLDNNSLERVEILSGPASTVYGSDALGGVIHLRTRQVQLSEEGQKKKFGANTFFRYGTINHEKTGHLDMNVAGKKFGSFTSFTFSEFDNLKMGKRTNPSFGEEFGLRKLYAIRSADNSQDILITNADPYVQKFSGYNQVDLLQKFLYKTSQNIEHSLNIQFSNSSDIPRYDRLTDPDGNGLKNAEWYYGPQKRLLTSYNLSKKNLGSYADGLSTTVSYQRVEESRHDRKFNQADRRNQFEKVDVFGLTVDFNKQINKSGIRYGFDGQWNRLSSTAFNKSIITAERSAVETRYPDGKNDMHFYGLYFTHTYDINRKLTLNSGLRVGASRLQSTFENIEILPFPFNDVKQNNQFYSANVGVIYRPSSWKLSFLTGTGYRVPNVDDLAKVFETKGGEALIIPNENVKPEKTVNFDLGITKHFGHQVSIETIGFYTLFYDAIVLDNYTINGQATVNYNGEPTRVLANQNKRKAYITGFNSILHFYLTSYFAIHASVNYTYGRINTDSADAPLDHIPPIFGRISFKFGKQKINAELFGNFNGWKRIDDYLLNAEDNEIYATPKGMPSWYTINLRFGYHISKHITVQSGVDNLTDLQYRTFASGINAPGRNIFGTIRFSF